MNRHARDNLAPGIDRLVCAGCFKRLRRFHRLERRRFKTSQLGIDSRCLDRGRRCLFDDWSCRNRLGNWSSLDRSRFCDRGRFCDRSRLNWRRFDRGCLDWRSLDRGRGCLCRVRARIAKLGDI